MLHKTLLQGSTLLLGVVVMLTSSHRDDPSSSPSTTPPTSEASFQEGRETFRFDTFGDEVLWTDTLLLNQAIAGQALGGVGPGLDPLSALGLGLKLDSEVLSPGQWTTLLNTVDLTDPAVTLRLISLDAVVGVRGRFGPGGQLDSVGISCALCHSTVDDSIGPGIGRRLDGWPNRDLDVGAIMALAPDVSHFENLLGVDEATVRTVLRSWGPGRFDAHLLLDGKAFRPDGASGSVLIPAALGLAGVNLATYTGWGSISYWNAFVGVLEMGGQGTFRDERLNDAQRHPVAASHGFASVQAPDDQLTGKLAALQAYQLALEVPAPPPGSFDPVAAERGRILFENRADCASCHVPPLFTDPGWNLHTPAEIGIDSFQAERSPTGRYRTTPLRGLSTRTRGGYYHDGRFPTLHDVVQHYDQHFALGLNPAEELDLVEFLRSL